MCLPKVSSLRERLQLPKKSFGGDRTPRRKRLKRRMRWDPGYLGFNPVRPQAPLAKAAQWLVVELGRPRLRFGWRSKWV